jgi:CAI-1 autoinducer synthase
MIASYTNRVKKFNAKYHYPIFLKNRMDDHYFRVDHQWGGGHILHGAIPGQNAIYLSSNDYLNLVGEPQLVQAQIDAMRQENNLLMSAVFLHGENYQSYLEKKLARYMGAENGILSQSGWSANVGLIQCLANEKIPVYLDILAHASLWEGAHAASAPSVYFIHNNIEHLRRQIRKYGPGVIAVDSIYSTNGSVCPIQDIVKIAEENSCILIIDESHSMGTHGPKGAGLVMELGLSESVHFITTSLAKAFAGRGGFITCSDRFKGYFLMQAKPAIFSSCLFNHELAWFNAALTFIQSADSRREKLKLITQRLRQSLIALGYNVCAGTEQIIALEAGPEEKTLVLRNALQKREIFGAVFCAPATAKNKSIVRLTLNSGLTDLELDRVIKVCEEIRDEIDLNNWLSTREMKKNKDKQLIS